jgi:MinD-like ATPase involved in chromosome partitioning or flagellar assembly
VRGAAAVALVFSPDPWVEHLHRFLADHGGARVRQLVVDPAVLDDEEFDVLVTGDRWPALTPALVGRVRARGARVLGVFDPTEPAGKDHLLAVGVDMVVAGDAPPGELVDAIGDLAAQLALEPTDTGSSPRPAGAAAASAGPVVVTGAPGSGCTEVGVALAVHLASRGRTRLLDVRSAGAGVGVRLGLPLEPNLRAAVDELAYGNAVDECLLTLARSGLAVLSGFPNASAAAQVAAGDVRAVVEELRTRADWCVVLADGELLTGLVPGARLVVVSAPTPLGVARSAQLLRGLGTSATVVAVNRAPRDRFRVGELQRELATLPGVAAVCVIPEDRRVATAAWDGVVVGEGPFVRAVESLAAAVTGGARPRRRRHSQRHDASSANGISDPGAAR